MDSRATSAPAPRSFGALNGRGLWSLYRRGNARYFRYWVESIGGPLVSSLLFLVVFHFALGGGGDIVPGVSLIQFIAPGIVIFSLTHSAFEGAAIPLLYDKIEGMIGDIVSAPLTPLEITAGYALSAASDGLITGAVILGVMAVFIDLPFHSLAAVLGFAVAASFLFALFGTLVGIWADRWDNYGAAEAFVILPLGLLSGAFFTLDRLPEGARWVFELNPVFLAVDGFRYGFTGQSQGNVLVEALVLAGLILALWLLVWRLIARGYKIKA